ncbi:oligosaccharide flippase family protein [Sphingopyxis sp. OPL5]|uniref:lipopolysaccharide biosynthesis protein n=1 Tax=Sphingopyxis sp. OPL5 TaxID=2486273 RepID=UPI00164D47D1|nr:oligosaccharide flippase family protein [Sphingopyxis sp. OPL5]QNO26763.1 oligosaccharide flippase family protein [Sphingopyxis sp. OPL5]
MKTIADRLVNISRLNFVRNFATLSGGQAIATLIPILTAPILGRLYLPADYGVLGTYMAFGAVLATIGNLQYFKGVIVDKQEHDAIATLALAMRITLGMSVLALAVVALVRLLEPASWSNSELWPWFWLLPLTILMASQTAALQAFANRQNRYGFMSRLQIVSVVVTTGLSIGLGLLKWGAAGLMTAYFAGQIIAFFYVIAGNREAFGLARRAQWADMRAAAVRHRDFAQWTTPTAVVEQVAMAFPIYVLGLRGGMLDVVGHFNRARSLLALPVQMFATAIGQVFFRRGAEEIARLDSATHLFYRLAIGLTAIAVPMFGILYLIAPTLFVFVLGPNWHETGEVARILAPVIGLQFVVQPLTKILWLHGYQRLDFIMSISFAAFTIGAVLLATQIISSPMNVIVAYAMAQGVMYVAFLAVAFWIAHRHRHLRAEPAAL